MNDRVILAPSNTYVDIIAKFAIDYIIYDRHDTKKDQHEGALEFTIEFHNIPNILGLPPYELIFKKMLDNAVA